MSAREVLLRSYLEECRDMLVLPSSAVEGWLLRGPLDAPQFTSTADFFEGPRDAATPLVIVDRLKPLVHVLSHIPLRDICIENCALSENQLKYFIDTLFRSASSNRSQASLQTLFLRGNKMSRAIFDALLDICGTHKNLTVVKVDPAVQCPANKLDQACALNDSKRNVKTLSFNRSSNTQAAASEVSPRRIRSAGDASSFSPQVPQSATTAASPPRLHDVPGAVTLDFNQILAAARKSIDFGFGHGSVLPHSLLYFSIEYISNVVQTCRSEEHALEQMKRTEPKFLEWRKNVAEESAVLLYEPLAAHMQSMVSDAVCVFCGCGADGGVQAATPRLLLAELHAEAQTGGSCFLLQTPQYITNVCNAVLSRMKRHAGDPLGTTFLRPPDFCSHKCIRKFSRAVLCEAAGISFGVSPAEDLSVESGGSLPKNIVHAAAVTSFHSDARGSGSEPESLLPVKNVKRRNTGAFVFPSHASVVQAVVAALEQRAGEISIRSSDLLEQIPSTIRGISISSLFERIIARGVAIADEGSSARPAIIQPALAVRFTSEGNKPDKPTCAALLRHYLTHGRDGVNGSDVVVGVKLRPTFFRMLKSQNAAEPLIVTRDVCHPEKGGIACAINLVGMKQAHNRTFFEAVYGGRTLLVDEDIINQGAGKFGAFAFVDIMWSRYASLSGNGKTPLAGIPLTLVEMPVYTELALLQMIELFPKKNGGPLERVSDVGNNVAKCLQVAQRSLHEAGIDTASMVANVSVSALSGLVREYRAGNVFHVVQWWKSNLAPGADFFEKFAAATDRAARQLFASDHMKVHPALLSTVRMDSQPTAGCTLPALPRSELFIPDWSCDQMITNGVTAQTSTSIKSPLVYASVIASGDVVSFARITDAADFSIHGRQPTLCFLSDEPQLMTRVEVSFSFIHTSKFRDPTIVFKALLEVSFSDDGLRYTKLSSNAPVDVISGTSGCACIEFGNVGSHNWWRVQYVPLTLLGTIAQEQQQKDNTEMLQVTQMLFHTIPSGRTASRSFCFPTTADDSAVFSFDGRSAIVVPKSLRNIPSHAPLVDLLRRPDGFFSGCTMDTVRTVIKRENLLYVFSHSAAVVACDAYSGQTREQLTAIVVHPILKHLPEPLRSHLTGGIHLGEDTFLLFSGSLFTLFNFTSKKTVFPLTSWHKKFPGRALAEQDYEGLQFKTKLLEPSGKDPYDEFYFPFRSVHCAHLVASSNLGFELAFFSNEQCVRWRAPVLPMWSASLDASRVPRQATRPAATFPQSVVVPSVFDGVPVGRLYSAAAVGGSTLCVPSKIRVTQRGVRTALPDAAAAALCDRSPACNPLAPLLLRDALSSGFTIDVEFQEEVAIDAVEIIADPVGCTWTLHSVSQNDNLVTMGETVQSKFHSSISCGSGRLSRNWKIVSNNTRAAVATTSTEGIYSMSFFASSTRLASITTFENIVVRHNQSATINADQSGDDNAWVDLGGYFMVAGFSVVVPPHTVEIHIQTATDTTTTGAPTSDQSYKFVVNPEKVARELRFAQPVLCRWYQPRLVQSSAFGNAEFTALYVPFAEVVIRNIQFKEPHKEYHKAQTAVQLDLANTGGQLRREDRTYIVHFDTPRKSFCYISGHTFTALEGFSTIGRQFDLFTKCGDSAWVHRAASTIRSNGTFGVAWEPSCDTVTSAKFVFDHLRVGLRDIKAFGAQLPAIDFVGGLNVCGGLLGLCMPFDGESCLMEDGAPRQGAACLAASAEASSSRFFSVLIPPHMSSVEGLHIEGSFGPVTISGQTWKKSVLLGQSTQPSATKFDLSFQPLTLRSISLSGNIHAITKILFMRKAEHLAGVGDADGLGGSIHYGGKCAEVMQSPIAFPIRVGSSVIFDADGDILHFTEIYVTCDVPSLRFDVQAWDENIGYFRSITILTTASMTTVSDRWVETLHRVKQFKLVCAAAPEGSANQIANLSVAFGAAPVVNASLPFVARDADCRIISNGIINKKEKKHLLNMFSATTQTTPHIRFSSEAEHSDEEQLSKDQPASPENFYYITLDLHASPQIFVSVSVNTVTDASHELLVQYSDDNVQFTSIAVHQQENGWRTSSWGAQGIHRFWRICATIVLAAGRRRSRRATSVSEVEEGDEVLLSSLFKEVDSRGICNIVWHAAVPTPPGASLAFTGQSTRAMIACKNWKPTSVPNHDPNLLHAMPVGLPSTIRKVVITTAQRAVNAHLGAALCRATRSRVSPTLLHTSQSMGKFLDNILPNIPNVLAVLKPEAAKEIAVILGTAKLAVSSATVRTACHGITLSPSVAVQGVTVEHEVLGMPSGTSVVFTIQLSEVMTVDGPQIVQRSLLIAEQSWSSLRSEYERFDALSRIVGISLLPEQLITVHKWLQVDEVELFGGAYPPLPVPTPTSPLQSAIASPDFTQYRIHNGVTAIFQPVPLSVLKSALAVYDQENPARPMQQVNSFLECVAHGSAVITLHKAHCAPPADDIVTMDVTVLLHPTALSAEGVSSGATPISLLSAMRLVVKFNLSNNSVCIDFCSGVTFPTLFGDQEFLLHCRMTSHNAALRCSEVPDVVPCGVALVDPGRRLQCRILQTSLISLHAVVGSFDLRVASAKVSNFVFGGRLSISTSLHIPCRLRLSPHQVQYAASSASSCDSCCELFLGAALVAPITSRVIAEYIERSGASTKAWTQFTHRENSFTICDAGAEIMEGLHTLNIDGSDRTSTCFTIRGSASINGTHHRAEVLFPLHPAATGEILVIRFFVDPSQRVRLLQPDLWLSSGASTIVVYANGHVAMSGFFTSSNIGGSVFSPNKVTFSLSSAKNEKKLKAEGVFSLTSAGCGEPYSYEAVSLQGFSGGLVESTFREQHATDLSPRLHSLLVQPGNVPVYFVFSKVTVAGFPFERLNVSGTCNGSVFEEVVNFESDQDVVHAVAARLGHRNTVSFLLATKTEVKKIRKTK